RSVPVRDLGPVLRNHAEAHGPVAAHLNSYIPAQHGDRWAVDPPRCGIEARGRLAEDLGVAQQRGVSSAVLRPDLRSRSQDRQERYQDVSSPGPLQQVAW